MKAKHILRRIYVVNRWRHPGCGHFILIGLSKFWFGTNQYKLSVHLFGEDGSGIVRSVFRVPGGLAFEDNPVSFGYDHRSPLYPYSPIAEAQSVSWMAQCCEVIGNIHDNPELLKTE